MGKVWIPGLRFSGFERDPAISYLLLVLLKGDVKLDSEGAKP